jgi:transcriptional regulator
MRTTTERQRVITHAATKVAMRAKGWSDRTAAKHLGCTATHLSLVLNGHRASRRLLAKIDALPVRDLSRD